MNSVFIAPALVLCAPLSPSRAPAPRDGSRGRRGRDGHARGGQEEEDEGEARVPPRAHGRGGGGGGKEEERVRQAEGVWEAQERALQGEAGFRFVSFPWLVEA